MKTKINSDGITCVDMGTGKNLFSFGPSPANPLTITTSSNTIPGQQIRAQIKPSKILEPTIKPIDFNHWDYLKIPKDAIVNIDREISPYELCRSEITFVGEPIFEKENKKENKNKNKKEKEKKKIMELLELYERFQTENIEKSFDKQMEKLLEKDELVQATKEYNQRLNLLEDEEKIHRYTLDIERVLTISTQNEMNKITEKIKEAKNKLTDKCRIIKAHLELADTFEEKQEILKSYNVIDENGKLNILSQEEENVEEIHKKIADEINTKVEALDLPEEKVRKEKKSWKK